MGKKLFVGNLPFSLREETLEGVFAGAGKVESVKIVKDQKSGRSKGFAFVEMSTDDEAQKAISTLNNTEVEGRSISVAEARPQAPREDRGDRGGGGRYHSGGGGGYRR